MKHSFNTRMSLLARFIPALVLFSLIVLMPAVGDAATSGYGTVSAEIINESCGLLMSIKTWLFNIVYILGAIGLVIIAVSAFLGRFKFAHLIALGGGLFIVAAADLLIGFMTAGGGSVAC